nr:tyrosine-protein phosphatase non-receptor type 9-like [Anolis sagrei ordinatus]
MARKFDVLRAIELFHSYRETRLKEGIVKLKPHEEPLRSELLSGKFTILVSQALPWALTGCSKLESALVPLIKFAMGNIGKGFGSFH